MTDFTSFDTWVITEWSENKHCQSYKKDIAFFNSRSDAIVFSKKLSRHVTIELRRGLLDQNTGETFLLGQAFTLTGELGG